MARTRVAPKGCIVHRAEILPGGVEVGYRCAEDYGQKTYPLTRGQEGSGNYPTKWLRGVTGIRVNGAEVSGAGARVGFVLSPRHVVCWRDGRELDCKVR